MPQTLIEKIAQRYAVGLDPGQEVHAGDYISIRPAYCMTHDNTGAVIPKFKSIGDESRQCLLLTCKHSESKQHQSGSNSKSNRRTFSPIIIAISGSEKPARISPSVN